MNDQLSQAFAALSDPTRRDIVARLAIGDATVNELAEPFDVTVQNISKHIKVLEDAGLVSRTRDAQRRPVHFEAEVFDLMTKWIERYRQQAEARYQRLDAALANMQHGSNEDTITPRSRAGAQQHRFPKQKSRPTRTFRSFASHATSRRPPNN